MKRLALLLTFALANVLCFGQSFQQYIALRKQHKVTAAARPEALQSFVGDKVLEVQGVVKGSFRVGSRAALMLETPGGGTVIVDSDAVPEWLNGNETPARLLVRAIRPAETSALRALLIGVAPEAQIAAYDKEQAAKHKAAQAAMKIRSTRSSSGLYGPIGRGGTVSRTKKDWVLPSSDVTPIYAKFIRNQNPRLTESEAWRIAQGVIGFSMQYDVDARLIMAMVMVESGFNPNAVSRAGAMGLGQLMPGTAEWMRVKNPFDSIDNLSGTVKLVRTHLDQYKAKTGRDFEALVLSLAAYNAGAGAVRRAGGVPAYRETQNYVRKVISLYYRLAGVS
jgi:soluble lytic murein transglycosylase-like protein